MISNRKVMDQAYQMKTKEPPLSPSNRGNQRIGSIYLWRFSYSYCSLILLLTIIQNNTNFCHSVLLTNIYSKKLSVLTDFAHRYLIVPNPAASNRIEPQAQVAGESSSESSNLTPSPQAEAWKSSPQQTILQNKAKLYLQSNGSQPNSAQLDPGRVPGEPNVLEGLSTEFPNPNINNLGHEITKILKKFFLHGYDKRVRPNYSGPPALVNVSFHIIGISSVDEVQMDFTTDFYFRQKWYDPRLVFDPVGDIDELCVGAEFAEKIWLPDTFFANEKTATFHKATTENTFIRIAHTGRVYRSIRLTVTCSCPMDLQYFPMDRQRCKIEIESYGYNTRDIDYRWERGDASVSLNDKIELPQFKILGFKMGQELQNLSSGDYIRLYCEIHFVRSMGYYLIQIYIPASLIVMISWVSFWLHRNATPARVALGVTTVLTMTTLMSSTNAALPKISYIKSIDVFLGTCFVMVFASLLEYASVGYIGKRIAMKRKRLQDLQQMQQHHQKVCVAAAASAATAAAAAVQDPNLMTSRFAPTNGNKDSLIVTQLQVPFEGVNSESATSGNSQTLQRRSNPMKLTDSSKNMQRGQTPNGGDSHIEMLRNEPPYGQRSAIKVMLDGNQTSQTRYRDSPDNKKGDDGRKVSSLGQTEQAKTPLLAARAAIAAAAAVNQPSSSQATEFEVSQTHDMIRICGLTPSAIDKHSRVVFPICFVCFNLMYWIIYGHISQQIEDKGPPLIPFIKG